MDSAPNLAESVPFVWPYHAIARRPRKPMRADLGRQSFGRLVALNFVCFDAAKHDSFWECRCDCGTTKIIRASSLRRGQTSCGCRAKENALAHGHARRESASRTYRSWAGLKRRWPEAVCESWAAKHGFAPFLAEMGPRPQNGKLRRVDRSQPWSAENSRWERHTSGNTLP